MYPLGILLFFISYTTMAEVVTLTSYDAWQQFIANHPQRVVALVKPLCGHCKKIEQPFAQLAADKDLQHIAFARIDMSKPANALLKQEYGIQSVPQFFIESGTTRTHSSTQRDSRFMDTFKAEIARLLPPTKSTQQIAAADATVDHTSELYYPFTLPKLAYAYDALEPYIDAQTMHIHHEKHHQAYVDNLNAALKDHPELHTRSLNDMLMHLEELPASIMTQIRNHGGGHANHTFFWQCMQPRAQHERALSIKKTIVQQFGSFARFQQQFNMAAKSVFGSGWAWLVTDMQGNLSIIVTHNQDSPYSATQRPILGLDVWEHAYYLKYQNRRPDYITAWWQVINWQYVERCYQNALHSFGNN